MILIWLPLGLALPALAGWLAVRLLEWRTPVLGVSERWFYGALLGITLAMFAAFLANILFGAPFTSIGFAAIEGALVLALGIPYWFFIHGSSGPARDASWRADWRSLSQPRRWLLIILGCWILLRIALATTVLLTTPPYFDDTLNNWNVRGKVFYVTETLTLQLPSQRPTDPPAGTSSYPPTVSLTKASLAAFAGEWNEGLVNGIHIVWFLLALGILFFTLRRMAGLFWAGIGAYMLAVLPLYLIHGTNAYGDVFLSAHLLGAAALILHALCENDRRRAAVFLRLGAFATAMLVFTKNEALVMYLPVLLLITVMGLLLLRLKSTLTTHDAMMAVGWFAVLLLAVAIPWIGFKWMHGLTFGNAKGIAGIEIAWQPMVLTAVFVNTFFEGNWLLLYPLLIILLVLRWRQAFLSPLLAFTALFCIVYAGQLLIFLFTPLSTEALMQTGYARGLIQLAPVAVVIATTLLSTVLEPEKGKGIDRSDGDKLTAA
ncbi:MAG: hypothetical protein Greene041619_366 [Candidatus Peregrinibacteria bacterium Greene0416_19]|nr:MAG: hypothetical protein Greene041619_366 [Candidatus Peregrinibacteria bacterium Greene0416_19]